MTSPRDELVAIVDEQNRVTGSAPRWQVCSDNLPHRAKGLSLTNLSTRSLTVAARKTLLSRARQQAVPNGWQRHSVTGTQRVDLVAVDDVLTGVLGMRFTPDSLLALGRKFRGELG